MTSIPKTLKPYWDSAALAVGEYLLFATGRMLRGARVPALSTWLRSSRRQYRFSGLKTIAAYLDRLEKRGVVRSGRTRKGGMAWVYVRGKGPIRWDLYERK